MTVSFYSFRIIKSSTLPVPSPASTSAQPDIPLTSSMEVTHRSVSDSECSESLVMLPQEGPATPISAQQVLGK